ncbi:MAG: sulfotransferase domain-containing protein [Deltaproteobacteria bacterium]|nr:sulfotransferase domain-containing protein [Deltaproteobacteria bacterium]
MEILPDDVFLVSYPKSGNTWMRFLIGNYISDHKVDFTNSHLVVPDLHFNPEYCKEIHARPRFIKSHMPYTSKYPRVIYIVRDGRDVAVSYYYYRLKRGDLSKEETSFSEYLKDFYLEGIPLFGTWSQNVASWLDRMKDGNILLLKYEDVLKDTETELVKALEFAGLDIEKKRLERAIEESSFPRMQELEVRQHNECPTLGKELENKDILFVREGRSGGWKNYFSIEDEKAFYKYNNSVMDKLGYI